MYVKLQQEMTTKSKYSHTHAVTQIYKHSAQLLHTNVAVTNLNTVYIVDSCQWSKFIVT